MDTVDGVITNVMVSLLYSNTHRMYMVLKLHEIDNDTSRRFNVRVFVWRVFTQRLLFSLFSKRNYSVKIRSTYNQFTLRKTRRFFDSRAVGLASNLFANFNELIKFHDRRTRSALWMQTDAQCSLRMKLQMKSTLISSMKENWMRMGAVYSQREKKYGKHKKPRQFCLQHRTNNHTH